MLDAGILCGDDFTGVYVGKDLCVFLEPVLMGCPLKVAVHVASSVLVSSSNPPELMKQIQP